MLVPALLYLIEILHQTTTRASVVTNPVRLYLIEILHQTTTALCLLVILPRCILSKFYIKPQPCSRFPLFESCCILSKFYIKPQQYELFPFAFVVVSYRNSTSNHNLWTTKSASEMLYLIEILHQTTTFVVEIIDSLLLYLIEILHQTTTVRMAVFFLFRCILSKFYIKPQQYDRN